jgi:glycosyltransferase involved in cell wall biosynthesis
MKSLAGQTVSATEILIVRDGPVNSSVEHCIQSHTQNLPLRHLHFSKNRGLGLALRDGLKACNYELIARVDADDWSVPKRFQLQVDFLDQKPSVSVVGGWLKEYYQRPTGPVSVVRRTPSDSFSIARTAKRRNPINHPTVMFRKSHVLACGSYESCPLFEDYYLWTKMLLEGYCLSNLSEVLVETEVDSGYFARRGGLTYIKNELELLGKLRRIGFLSPFEASTFILSRLPMRLLPNVGRQYLYKALLRKK